MGDDCKSSETLPRARAYFITFATYGARLHGDAVGSVDREHHLYRTSYAPANPLRERVERGKMVESSYVLDEQRREVVLQSCREVCEFRRWWLFIAHVRSNHVHVVVQASQAPERVMNDLKAYSSRALSRAGLEPTERRRWARHGSTRYLWSDDQVRGAIRYVFCEQGKPMAIYMAQGLWRQIEV
jgi:REP element-mobilizing transposase RayT